MGDFANNGAGHNYTPGGLNLAAERIDRMPTGKPVCVNKYVCVMNYNLTENLRVMDVMIKNRILKGQGDIAHETCDCPVCEGEKVIHETRFEHEYGGECDTETKQCNFCDGQGFAWIESEPIDLDFYKVDLGANKNAKGTRDKETL